MIGLKGTTTYMGDFKLVDFAYRRNSIGDSLLFFIYVVKVCTVCGKLARQCCARVGSGTREPDPWIKIPQNRTQNCQKTRVSSRTGTGTVKGSGSVLKPEKGLKGPLLP